MNESVSQPKDFVRCRRRDLRFSVGLVMIYVVSWLKFMLFILFPDGVILSVASIGDFLGHYLVGLGLYVLFERLLLGSIQRVPSLLGACIL